MCHEEEWVRSLDKKPHGIVDISIATEHLCLAATERKLGTCWVCNFDVAKCVSLFNLPKGEEPAVLIPIGFPTADPAEKIRKDIGSIVRYV